MVGGQAGKFGNWAQGTRDDATCSLEKTRYQNACNCEADMEAMETSEASSIKSDSQCGWTDSYNCESYCDEGGSQSNDETDSGSDGSSSDSDDGSGDEDGSGGSDGPPEIDLGDLE